MNRNDFYELIKRLKSVYTLRTFLADAQSYEVWYEALGNIETERVNAAINRYIGMKNVPPTPADIKELLEHPEQKVPTYAKMNLWGLYDPEGNEVNDAYAPQWMSNKTVFEWFEQADNLEGYTVRLKKAAEVKA